MPLKGYKYSKEHAKNHLAAMRTATSTIEYKDNMSKARSGIAMRIDSLRGASETNENAKDWWFIKRGVHYRFRSLNKFVRDNKDLFTDEELTEYKTENRAAPVYQATVRLRQLLLLKKDGKPIIPSYVWHGWTVGEKWEQGYYDT